MPKSDSYHTGSELKRWFKYQMQESTVFWILLPFFLGIFILIIANLIGRIAFQSTLPPQINNIVAYCVFFSWGFSGIAIIVRREIPFTFFFRGIPAIIAGGFVLLFFWGMAILGFWRIFMGK
jgi:hypothetical protein